MVPLIAMETMRIELTNLHRPGLYACLAAVGLCVMSMCTTSAYFYSENKKQARGEKVIEGDPLFRYTY